jgi:hypothetical protein
LRSWKGTRVFIPVIAGQGGHTRVFIPRHCEEQPGQVRGATKQSLLSILGIVWKTRSKDCFGPATHVGPAGLAMTGNEWLRGLIPCHCGS